MNLMRRPDANEQENGLIILVSAPSGAGKTSLVRGLMEQDPRLRMGISHTTRPCRGTEQDAKDYYFISEPVFEQMRCAGEFLEYARVFGHMYGTSRTMLQELCAGNHDVILEIDWQGAAQLRVQGYADTSVFILPPNRESLENRLSGRGSDAREVIDGRLRTARHEIAQFEDYDYLLVNEDFDKAVSALAAIILAERSRTVRAKRTHAQVIWEFTESGGPS